MSKQRNTKSSAKPTPSDLKPERERRGQKSGPSVADQRGATEQQVQPLTPPMAESDQQPRDPSRGAQPDKGLDPADELTPG